MESPEIGSSPEQPKKKWKVLIEMEGYGKDGEEITGPALYEEVVVDADNEDEAEDIACNKDFGNRRVSYAETKEIKEDK
jgi:hypothetical protein